jgi:hypothetical protein
MYWGGSAFSYQPSISDSITSTRTVGENAAANQRGAAYLACFFFINHVENLRGFAEAASKKREGRKKKRIRRRYTNTRIGREVETGSRQRYTIYLSFRLFLSRESQFSLQPTGYGSIAEGETSRRWTRVDGRNGVRDGGTIERRRTCKRRRRRSMPTCVSKNHNFCLWTEAGVQAG